MPFWERDLKISPFAFTSLSREPNSPKWALLAFVTNAKSGLAILQSNVISFSWFVVWFIFFGGTRFFISLTIISNEGFVYLWVVRAEVIAFKPGTNLTTDTANKEMIGRCEHDDISFETNLKSVIHEDLILMFNTNYQEKSNDD